MSDERLETWRGFALDTAPGTLREAAQALIDELSVSRPAGYLTPSEDRLRAALAAPSRDAGLDAAWAEAEAALPEGWAITELVGDGMTWTAEAEPCHGCGGFAGHGDTPADALRSLAAARLADGAPFPAGVSRADSEGER